MAAEAKDESIQEDRFDENKPLPFSPLSEGKFDALFDDRDVTEGAKRLRTHTFSSKITIRHILIVHREASERKSARTNQTVLRSKAEARKILERLKPEITISNFGRLARENSDCESFDSDGDLGLVEPGMYAVDFDDHVYCLQVNEISDIFETDRGFHIAMREQEQLKY